MKPYTYLIGWSKLNYWYYGCEYKKTAHPDNLWTTYFTSSEIVKEMRIWHGEPDHIEVRMTFDTAANARAWEDKVIRRLGAVFSDKWLNRANGGKEFCNDSPQTRERMRLAKLGKKGAKRSELTKQKMRKAALGRKFSEEHKQKLCEARRKRAPVSLETKEKMRLARQGKTYEELFGVDKAAEMRLKQSINFSIQRTGKQSWNSGLTKDTSKKVAKWAQALSAAKQANPPTGDKNPFYGKKHLNETRLKWKLMRQGKKWSEEALAKARVTRLCNKLSKELT